MPRNTEGSSLVPTETKDQSSSPSSSDSSPSDPSLDRLFGAIARALDGLVAGDLSQRKQLGEVLKNVALLQKYVESSTRRTDGRLTQLQIDLGSILERVDQLVEHQKTVYGAAIDVRKVVDASREKVDTAIETWKEETGKHQLLKAEFDELQGREEISMWGIRVRWVTLVKYGKLYGPVAVKVAGLVAAIVAALYQLVSNLGPLLHGWHW